MMLSHSDIVLRTVFRANKISLRPEGVISLSQSENITLCTAKNITYLSFFVVKKIWVSSKKKHLYLQMRCRFYPISIRKASMKFIEALIILMRSSLSELFSFCETSFGYEILLCNVKKVQFSEMSQNVDKKQHKTMQNKLPSWYNYGVLISIFIYRWSTRRRTL